MDADVENGVGVVDTAVKDAAEVVAVVAIVAATVVVRPTEDVATKNSRTSRDGQWVCTELTHYLAPLGGDCTPGHGGVYQDASPLGQAE